MSPLLITILGDEYEQGKEVGMKILSYLAKHPEIDLREWEFQEKRERLIDAMNKACGKLYGTGLYYYLRKTRQRDVVEVRWMLINIYRRTLGAKLEECGKVFNLDHSTIVYGEKMLWQLNESCDTFASSFAQLEKEIKNSYVI